MKAYLLSLSVGVLVGIAYALLSVRSPAPPAIALLGLLGMLVGEQAVPVAKRWILGSASATVPGYAEVGQAAPTAAQRLESNGDST